MPRNGLGMPISASQSQAAPVVIDDVLWEDFSGSGGEIAVNYQETRTNIVLHSQDATDAEAWTKQNTAISTTLYEAPDNSTTANAIKSNTTGSKNYYLQQQSLSVTAGKTYTASVHLKKGTLGFGWLRAGDGTTNYSAVFNLNTGAVTNTSQVLSTSVDAMDNDWFRCSVTFKAQNTSSNGNVMVFAQIDATDNTPNIAVSGVELLYVWGWQLEENIEESPYIVTTTEARTATTSLNDTSDVWDFDSANLMPEADPDSEGVWEIPANVVLNGDYEELGSELANFSDSNISFGNSSDSTTISLSANSYRSEAFGNTGDDRPRVTINGSGIVTGKTYEVTYTPTSFTGSTVFDFFQNNTRIINNHDASIAKTFYFVASSSLDAFVFDGSDTFRSDYTLSIKQVDPNDRWTLGTGWSIEDGKAKGAAGTQSNLTTANNPLTVGDTVEITYTISDYVAGSAKAFFGGGLAGTVRTSNGTFTEINVVTTNGSFLIQKSADGNLSIDNVSVKEYAIQPLDI